MDLFRHLHGEFILKSERLKREFVLKTLIRKGIVLPTLLMVMALSMTLVGCTKEVEKIVELEKVVEVEKVV